MMFVALWVLRIVGVVALLCVAAATATPKGRIPLALRGLQKFLRRDCGAPARAETTVSSGRRFLAFVLVVLAALICMI